MTYEEAIDYIQHASVFGVQLGLGRIQELLNRLGNPQKKYKTIHVTGTNGKGSVTAMIASALCEAGFRTGRYTSPHLEEYTERIHINGDDISRADFATAVAVVREKVEAMAAEGLERPTEFEMITAAAFWHFAKAGVEYAVIEVGLGGLLDSTNVIIPEVSVITNVAMDHMKYCGNTIEEIATQKAGIIKEGCPCILSPCNDESAVKVFKRQAKEKNALLLIPDMREIKITDTGFEYLAKNRYRGHYSPAMAGEHQVRNAAAVISACIVAGTAAGKGFDLPPEAVKAGIESARLHGRAEIISRRPLIISDGGHNPDAAKALRQVMSGFYKKGERFTAVIGMSEDKNIKEYIRTVMPYIERFIPVDDFSDRAKNAKELSEIIKSCGGEVMPVMQTENAVSALFSSDSAGLICGSLYLVSAAQARSPRG